MKKILLGCLMLLLFALFPGYASAETVILTRAELEAVAEHPEGQYVLGADIDLGGTVWTPIPSLEGSLDGAGHAISNMRIDSGIDGAALGLFSQVSGTISNLKLTNFAMDVQFSGDQYQMVTVFGSPVNNYGQSLGELDFHFFNCEADGRFDLKGGSGSLVVNSIRYASGCSLSADISCEADNYMSVIPLMNCAECTYAGTIEAQGDDYVNLSAMYSCAGCSSEASIMAQGRQYLYATVLDYCTDCSHVGTVDAKGDSNASVTGLSYCSGCSVQGDLLSQGDGYATTTLMNTCMGSSFQGTVSTRSEGSGWNSTLLDSCTDCSAECGEITGQNLYGITFMRSCTDCTMECGVLTVQNTNNLSFMDNCSDCAVDCTMSLESDSAASLSVTGISAGHGNELNGSLFGKSVSLMKDGAEDSVCDADVTAVTFTGLENCVECTVDGGWTAREGADQIQMTFIRDQADGEGELRGNTCNAVLDLDSLHGASTLHLSAKMGDGSVLNTPLVFEDLGETNFSLTLSALGENPVFRDGDCTFITTTGNINFRSELATYADTYAKSGSGSIDIVAASYNDGTVTAESESGRIHLVGGSAYNFGSVTAVTNGSITLYGANGDGGFNMGNIRGESGNGSVSVYGANGTNCLNLGAVTAISRGELSVYATGAYGSGAWNDGAVTAEASGNNAYAYGSYASNTGSVTAQSTGGYAYAYGADRYNSGAVTARGAQVARAYAHQSESDESVNEGAVSAYSSSGNANATGKGGTAYAEGKTAYAEGAEATAYCTEYTQMVSNGQQLWKLTGHNMQEDIHGIPCTAPDLIINYEDSTGATWYPDSDGFPIRGHEYRRVAGTKVLGGNGGEIPVRPENPEMPKMEGRVSVSMKLYDPDTEEQISAFTWTFGSFSWDKRDADGNQNDDYSKLELRLVFTNRGKNAEERAYTIRLPDGFSFNEDEPNLTLPGTVSLAPGETSAPVKLPVYPLYLHTLPTNNADFSIEISGDLEKTAELTVEEIAEAEKGMIYMRNTMYVSNLSPDEPFKDRISIDPVEDFTGDSARYSDSRLVLGAALSQAAYNENPSEELGVDEDSGHYLTQSLHNLGFSNTKWVPGIGTYSEIMKTYYVAVGFGHKRVVSGDSVYNVISVSVRGTVAYEWIGNFDMTDGAEKIHKNFAECAERVKEYFNDYLAELHRRGISTENMKLYVCGHSRAGAVVDLIVHDWNTPYGMENIYAYTFAAPNSIVRDPDYAFSAAFDRNIFNYIYKYDIVPFAPHRAYGKYGVNLVVGGDNEDTAPDAVEAAFTRYTAGRAYKSIGGQLWLQILLATDQASALYPFISQHKEAIAWWEMHLAHGGWIANAHGAENYLAWAKANGAEGAITVEEFEKTENEKLMTRFMNSPGFLKQKIVDTVTAAVESMIKVKDLSASAFNSFNEYGRWLVETYYDYSDMEDVVPWILPFIPEYYQDGVRFLSASCPVDTELLDADGNVLVRFADHQLVERQRGSIACVRGQSDCVFLPAENGYTLRLTATDDGTMNIDYAFFTGEESCSAAETILKIPVHRGEVFTVTVTGDEETLPSVVSSTGAVYDLSHNLQFLPDPERILVLPASVRVVEDEAFRGSAAEMIVIPASVTDIGTLAFADCPHLKLVCFERGEVRAAEDILAGCNDSVRIVAPEDSAAARQIEQFRQYLEP